MEGSEGLYGVRPVNRMQEVGVKVEVVSQFPFDAIRAGVEQALEMDV